VEGGDYCSPIRDGPGLRFGVIWKRYVSVVTHRKALHRYGTTLFKDCNETVEQPRERMEDPVHVTLNTTPSAMSPCVNSSSGPNRLSACEAPPVLCTGFSKDLPEQLQCSEKGGEIDTRHKSTTRNAVGSKNRSSASGGVISKDTIKRTTSNCLSTMTEGREESQQLNPTQIQGSITEDTPVALRTRRSRQQTVPIRTKDDRGDLFQATKNQNKDNELIKQLKAKIMDQENTISELSSAM